MLRKASKEVYLDKKKEYRWRLISSNGKIMADSGEGYKKKTACVKALDRVTLLMWNTPSSIYSK